MSKMARNNPTVSPEEAVDLARQMRRLIYGGDGVPEWGTKFSRIEADALEVERELSRLIMEQAVGEQAQPVPSPALAEAGAGSRPHAIRVWRLGLFLARAHELGEPTAADKETSPRRIVPAR
jgi:hypothetical protein